MAYKHDWFSTKKSVKSPAAPHPEQVVQCVGGALGPAGRQMPLGLLQAGAAQQLDVDGAVRVLAGFLMVTRPETSSSVEGCQYVRAGQQQPVH